jgi:hypothetical protein
MRSGSQENAVSFSSLLNAVDEKSFNPLPEFFNHCINVNCLFRNLYHTRTHIFMWGKASSYYHDNETLASTNGGERLDQPADHQFLKITVLQGVNYVNECSGIRDRTVGYLAVQLRWIKKTLGRPRRRWDDNRILKCGKKDLTIKDS